MTSKIIAVEQSDVRALNYDPGYVDTFMWRDYASHAIDERVKNAVRTVETGGKLIKPEQTAWVLADVLEKDEFETGGRVTYFDIAAQE